MQHLHARRPMSRRRRRLNLRGRFDAVASGTCRLGFTHAWYRILSSSRAVSQLDHLDIRSVVLSGKRSIFTARCPSFAAVVAIEDVGMIIPASGNAVIARNNQTSFVVAVLQLNAVSRTGCIPRPVRSFCLRSDFRPARTTMRPNRRSRLPRSSGCSC